MKLLILCCITHFIADFILQSREMGKNKSSSWYWLGYHLLIQFICFIPVLGIKQSLINALIHGVIDKNIWNLYKVFVVKYYKITKETSTSFKYWEDHWFYTTIGLDQMLHMLTLIMIVSFQ